MAAPETPLTSGAARRNSRAGTAGLVARQRSHPAGPGVLNASKHPGPPQDLESKHCSKDIAMTQTLNPNDTGEIRRTPGDATTNLAPHITQALAHVSPNLRSADATEIIPLFEAPLFEQFRQPEPSPPKPPTWDGPALSLPTVRTAVDRSRGRVVGKPPRLRRGRHRQPVSRLGWALVGAGLTVLALAAAVGVSALMGVQW